MPVKLRLTLFFTFVSLFFLLLPVLTVYSLGFRYNPSTHRLERLGMISIRTVPDEARVLLNQKLLKQKTPVELSDLFPGTYSLAVFFEGYRPWQGKVTVKPNWVTRLESLLLFPEEVQTLPVTDLFAHQFFLSPRGTKMILLAESGEDRGLWLLDLFLEEETLIVDEKELAGRNGERDLFSKEIRIQWSKDERALLIERRKKFFLLDLKKPNRITPLKEVLGFEPEQVQWSDQTSDVFYYRQNETLGKFAFRRKKGKGNLLANVSHFQNAGPYIFYLERSSGTLRRFAEETEENISLGQVPEFDPLRHYEFIVHPLLELLPPRHQVDLLKDRYFFYEVGLSKEYEGIRQALWNKTGRDLLLIKGRQGLILAESALKNKTRSEIRTADFPRGLEKIDWYDDEKILLAGRRQVYLAQVGEGTDAYTQEIISFPHVPLQTEWESRFKRLYVIERVPGGEGNRLVRVSLASGPFSKWMNHMRETMSEGVQFLYEVSKK